MNPASPRHSPNQQAAISCSPAPNRRPPFTAPFHLAIHQNTIIPAIYNYWYTFRPRGPRSKFEGTGNTITGTHGLCLSMTGGWLQCLLVMYFVDNQNITDPRLNLALEEYLLRHVDLAVPLLLLYINEPAVIIGRNQNTAEEIDPDYVREQGIHVLRRLSGGGAVYHDHGNLNFSFITPGKEHLRDFRRFTGPIIQALGDLGVQAELRGKSDIFAAGKKISGNAQYSTAGRMFSHGTLLFDSDLEALLKALNPRQVQIESKAVQSMRSQVVNIRQLLLEPMTIAEFRLALLRGLFGGPAPPVYDLSPAAWQKIEQISADRYQQWDWNFGRSPKFTVRKTGRYRTGELESRIEVRRGRIGSIEISGGSVRQQEVIELASQLAGIAYNRPALAAALATIGQTPYFGVLSQEEMLDLLY